MSVPAAFREGFEQGPIRPPNEAFSLLVRVTRNCPYNHCTFCPVYKDAPFSLRKVEQVKADIASMARIAEQLAPHIHAGQPSLGPVAHLAYSCPEAMQVARFLASGEKTAFLQDANSLIMPFEGLLEVLQALREAFPSLERVTTYARAHTVCKRSVEQLTSLREAGLDRIHIGLESGSDEVLALVKKGITAERHIVAGCRVKEAGIELSEYVMPGLGGRRYSAVHARETARVLRAIDPHFIRLRTLAIAPGSLLDGQVERGELEPLGDIEIVKELRELLSGLTGMSSTIVSDHILNLLEQIDGKLPDDLPRMLALVDSFLALDDDERDLFLVGRRLGIMRSLDDLNDNEARSRAAKAIARLRRHFDGPLDRAVRELATHFV